MYRPRITLAASVLAAMASITPIFGQTNILETGKWGNIERRMKRKVKREKKRTAKKSHDRAREMARNLKRMGWLMYGQFPEYVRLEAKNIKNGKWRIPPSPCSTSKPEESNG